MSSLSRQTPYEIARSTGRCCSTDRVIEPGETYMATLCERAEDAGFDRFDFGLDVWETGVRPERLFSFWRTTLPEATKKRDPFVDDELLLNFFHRLADDDEPLRVAFRFVVMLILLRKRLVKHVGTTSRAGVDDRAMSVWQVRMKGESPETTPIEVVDPELSDDQVREVSDELGAILQGSS